MWQASENRIIGVSGNATDDQLYEIAQRLVIVEETRWTQSLPGYTRQGP